MKLQLASYKLSKLAQDKGFDWECIESYNGYNNDQLGFNIHTQDELDKYLIYPAPSLDLLSKWFRDVHKIHVSAFPVVTDRYYFTINKITDKGLKKIVGGPYDPKDSSDTYEEAAEKALFKAMELI